MANDDEDNAATTTNDSNDEEINKQKMNPFTKASWYAVEAFGKAFGSSSMSDKKGPTTVSETDDNNNISYSTDRVPSSLAETFARIRADNNRAYFLSGMVDELIYDERCVFADPFVSFEGRDRFVENLANLGSFVTDYSARPLDYNVAADSTVTAKFMVKLELNLPWKPVLAWPWGVRCEIDPETYQVILHEESWDIEPWEGVKQIFRKPTVKVN